MKRINIRLTRAHKIKHSCIYIVTGQLASGNILAWPNK